jgi:FkbM family methyltransferase
VSSIDRKLTAKGVVSNAGNGVLVVNPRTPQNDRGVRMSGRIKTLAYYIANDLVLAPIGLKLSLKIGNNPIRDMVRLLKMCPVSYIVDGGAHTGSFSHQAASAFPSSRIEAFEPATVVFSELLRKIAKSPRIKAHKLALGAGSETRTFHNNQSPQTSSLRRVTAAGERYFHGLVTESEREEVRIVTLSEFCRERGIGQLDIIKLDLQGGEMDALKGAGVLLGMAKIVFLEVQFLQLYEDCALFSDLDVFLRSNGLDLYQFYDLVRSPIDGRLLYGDAMFVTRSLLADMG